MNDRPSRIEVVVDSRKYQGRGEHFSGFVIDELRKAGIPMGPGPMIRITEGTLTRVVNELRNVGEMLFIWTAE